MLDKIYFGNYADKNTPYSSNEGIDQVIRTMEEFSIPLLNDLRIAKNINPFKYHLPLCGNKRLF